MSEPLAPLLARHKPVRESLIPVLQEIQEKLNYIPEESISEIARYLRVSSSELFGVITFYSQFRTVPVGKNRVMVCRGTACHVRGANQILTAVRQHLHLKEGETSADLKFTLETVACIGACALAPNMVVNQDTYGRLNTKKAVEILSHREES